MTTCFLFTQHLNETSCLSLSLNQQGEVEAPLLQRSFAEISTLQANAQTIVMTAGKYFSLHQVELPWLAEKKARTVIPFALEDKLAQGIESLHCAFDYNHHQNGHYLVVVADKDYLKELVARLDEQNLHFNILTLDWFALAAQEACITEDSLLVNEDAFQGVLAPDLAGFYLNEAKPLGSLYRFNDSNPNIVKHCRLETIEIKEESYLWLAKRLQKAKAMNLCQGEMTHGDSQEKAKHWYKAASLMTALWLISILCINGFKVHSLNKETALVDEKIAKIYHEFFPQAQQVISPKFRIGQLLKSRQTGSDSSFWVILDKLATITKNDPATIEQLRFQNQSIVLTLATKDFESLEKLQNSLEQAQIKVKQTQASTDDGQVLGTLELSL